MPHAATGSSFGVCIAHKKMTDTDVAREPKICDIMAGLCYGLDLHSGFDGGRRLSYEMLKITFSSQKHKKQRNPRISRHLEKWINVQ